MSENQNLNPANTGSPEGDDGRVDDAVTLDVVINDALGTTYQSPEDALNGLKELQSYTGEYGKVKPKLDELKKEFGTNDVTKIMEQLTKQGSGEPNADGKPGESNNEVVENQLKELETLKSELKSDRFYAKNPEYDNPALRTVISAMAKGGELDTVVETDEFKAIFDNFEIAAQAEKAKSVLHSSPRTQQVRDKMEKAKEALIKEGNSLKAEDTAVSAVMDAFDIK